MQRLYEKSFYVASLNFVLAFSKAFRWKNEIQRSDALYINRIEFHCCGCCSIIRIDFDTTASKQSTFSPLFFIKIYSINLSFWTIVLCFSVAPPTLLSYFSPRPLLTFHILFFGQFPQCFCLFSSILLMKVENRLQWAKSKLHFRNANKPNEKRK